MENNGYILEHITKKDNNNVDSIQYRHTGNIEEIGVIDLNTMKTFIVRDARKMIEIRKNLVKPYVFTYAEAILYTSLKFMGYEPFQYQPICDREYWAYVYNILDDSYYKEEWVKHGEENDGTKKEYYGEFAMEFANSEELVYSGEAVHSCYFPCIDAKIEIKGDYIEVPVLRENIHWVPDNGILHEESTDGWDYLQSRFTFEKCECGIGFEGNEKNVLLGKMIYKVTNKQRLLRYLLSRG